MPRSVKGLLIALRAIAVALLLLGIVIWTGRPVPWRGVHVGLGMLLGVLLLVLGAAVARATRRAGPLLVVTAWTLVLVGFGLAHARLWPGGAHWLAQVLHLLTGLATLGVAERLAAPVRRGAGASGRAA